MWVLKNWAAKKWSFSVNFLEKISERSQFVVFSVRQKKKIGKRKLFLKGNISIIHQIKKVPVKRTREK